MSYFLILAFLFSTGCSAGWCIEVLFRRFCYKEQHFMNPGFLVGPYLPLYGFGVCLLYLLAGLEPLLPIRNPILSKLILFFIMSLCMTLLEYIAGIIFIKRMHIKLWDYSKNRGNIQGIICPLFSFFWAVLGAVYYFLIHPYILDALQWFSQNLTFSFFIGMFYGIFFIDLAYSFQIVAKIKRFADENEILVRYEELKMQIKQSAESRMKKQRFLFAFRSDVPLTEHLKTYLEKQKATIQSVKNKYQSKNK